MATEKRTLTCLLTAKERLARGADMGRAIHDWESTNEEKKTVTKDLGDRIKEHEANMKRLSRIVRTGKEEREVEVEWRPFAESETMRLIRLDTGEEVQSRPMTREEKDLFRQQPLPLNEPVQPTTRAPLQLTGPIVTEPPPPPPLQLPGPIATEPPPTLAALPDMSEEILDVEFEELGPEA